MDLNARTGMLNDIKKQHAGKDLFLDNVNQCMHNLNNFRYNCDFRNCDLIRINKDKVVNRYGRELITLCKTNSLVLLNGRFSHDRGIGNYTRLDTTGMSVVDLCNYTVRNQGNLTSSCRPNSDGIKEN